MSRGFPTDPNVGKNGYIVIRPGITIRLTRNIDKERGFVNGAIAVVVDVLVDYNPSEEATHVHFYSTIEHWVYDFSASGIGW